MNGQCLPAVLCGASGDGCWGPVCSVAADGCCTNGDTAVLTDVCNEHCSVYTSLWLIITCFRLRIAYVEAVGRRNSFNDHFVTQSLNLLRQQL